MDTEIKLIGNGHLIPLLYAWELTDKTLAKMMHEHDWAFNGLESPLDCEHQFFYYRGWWYVLDDFMRVEKHAPEWMRKFDGYTNDSFFSGVVIRYMEDDYGDLYLKAWTFIS